MTDKNVQQAPPSEHDITHDDQGVRQTPDPKHMEQGTKPSELRDAGDRAEHPSPGGSKKK
jgi:hypothetical protein